MYFKFKISQSRLKFQNPIVQPRSCRCICPLHDRNAAAARLPDEKELGAEADPGGRHEVCVHRHTAVELNLKRMRDGMLTRCHTPLGHKSYPGPPEGESQ